MGESLTPLLLWGLFPPALGYFSIREALCEGLGQQGEGRTAAVPTRSQPRPTAAIRMEIFPVWEVTSQ